MGRSTLFFYWVLLLGIDYLTGDKPGAVFLLWPIHFGMLTITWTSLTRVPGLSFAGRGSRRSLRAGESHDVGCGASYILTPISFLAASLFRVWPDLWPALLLVQLIAGVLLMRNFPFQAEPRSPGLDLDLAARTLTFRPVRVTCVEAPVWEETVTLPFSTLTHIASQRIMRGSVAYPLHRVVGLRDGAEPLHLLQVSSEEAARAAARWLRHQMGAAETYLEPIRLAEDPATRPGPDEESSEEWSE